MFVKAPCQSGKFAESRTGRRESISSVALERRGAMPRAVRGPTGNIGNTLIRGHR